MTKPKECVIQNCTNVFYVSEDKLHMCTVCEECQEKKPEAYNGNCPVCQSSLTTIQEGENSTLRECDSCGSEWVRDGGDITLNSILIQ